MQRSARLRTNPLDGYTERIAGSIGSHMNFFFLTGQSPARARGSSPCGRQDLNFNYACGRPGTT